MSSIITWNTPGSASALTLSSVNSLANGSSSGLMTYDNSTAKDLYAALAIVLGSFTSTAGATITVRVYAVANGTTPDDTGSVGGGDTYTVPVTVGASGKNIVIPMIRLYPFSLRIQITNNAGAAFASSGNSINVVPFNELAN